MEHRDLIKDQIEQLGKILGKIFSNFMGLKTEGNITAGMEIAEQNFKEELDLDIEIILGQENKNLSNYLTTKGLTPKHFDQLSDYLFECGNYFIGIDNNKARKTLDKALELMNLADEESKMYSFERKQKGENIRGLIRKINL